MCLGGRCWSAVAVSQLAAAAVEPVAAVLVSDREEQRKPVGTPGGA